MLRHHWLGYATVVGQLIWLGLTCLPIVLTPFVAKLRGDDASWSVMVPIGILCVATLAMLCHVLYLAAPPEKTERDTLKGGVMSAPGTL